MGAPSFCSLLLRGLVLCVVPCPPLLSGVFRCYRNIDVFGILDVWKSEIRVYASIDGLGAFGGVSRKEKEFIDGNAECYGYLIKRGIV